MNLQYLAGLVDGEGHFTVFNSINGRGETHRRCLLRVVQHDKNQGEQLFDIIKDKYGGTLLYKKRYEMWEWSIYGAQARALAKKLKPYLIVKAYQVDRLFADDNKGRVYGDS